MANEIRVTQRLEITNGNLQYQSRPFNFQVDQTNPGGPTPGIITATVDGTNVSLAGLTMPGWCRIQNQDLTNYIKVGLTDGTYFYPLLEIPPGMSQPLCLYRYIGTREDTPGTGTSSASLLSLRIAADTAPCKVLVEAFEK